MNNEELVRAIQNKDIDTAEGMEQLYNQNKGAIYKIACKYSAYAEMDDLMQEAYFGLCRVVEKYSDVIGTKFITYAMQWIKQSIARYVANNKSVIRVPAHRQALLLDYERLIDRYKKEYNREPNDKEIAYNLNISSKMVQHLKKDHALTGVKSIDTYIQSERGEDITIADTISANVDIEAEVLDDILYKDFNEEFWGIISDKLEEQENQVIIERYRNEHTRAELTDILSVNSTEPVTINECRSIENKALSKLKRSNLARLLNERFDIAIGKAYRGSIWSGNVLYSPTEAAAFSDMRIKI